RQQIYLGALLHDIGKFYQRASENPKEKTHQEFGYDWLIEKLPERYKEGIPSFAKLHHAVKGSKKDELDVFSNKSNLTLIVYEADNLSSGFERKQIIDETKEYIDWDETVAMYSIFSKINLSSENHGDIPVYHNVWKKLKPDLISESIPIPEENVEITHENYKKLFKDFEESYNYIKNNLSPNNLIVLLEKYLTNIPSYTYIITEKGEILPDKYPDISLFDHSKVTAAIALCMYNYFFEHEDFKSKFEKNELLENEILNRTDNKYLLVGGDISGVQDFIYTISSNEALKSLRGRSFYLEMLTEHVVSEILTKLNLERANLIYSGGGGFYILAQNTENAKKVIDEIKNAINKWLYDEFNGKLYFNIEYVSFSGNKFSPQISDVWSELSIKIENSKKQKYKHNLSEIFRVLEPKLQNAECRICHTDEKDLVEDTCGICRSLVDLGRELKERNNDIIYETDNPNDLTNGYFKINNKYYKLGSKKQASRAKGKVYVINSWNLNDYKYDNSIQLLLGNYVTSKADSFEDLCKIEGTDRFDYIGVLRLDVDNLGKIFSGGINKTEATFSRMASISRNLTLFFKYYINQICYGNLPLGINQTRLISDNSNKEREVVIVYSGGDDLFLVGKWNDVIELSKDIYSIFKAFVCNNPDLGISGGITLHRHDFPLYQMARYADEAEKNSKNNKYVIDCNEKEKNSISLLYDEILNERNKKIKEKVNEDRILTAIPWDSFNQVSDFTKSLNYLYGKVSHSLIYKLFKLLSIWQQDGEFYIPQLNRIQKEIKEKLKDDHEFSKKFNNDLILKLMLPEQMKTLHLSLLWAEYLNKKSI
ncbi:type III-A CRISPR-associated protein Cas10/Csm1, partial [Tenuifilum sp.]|uniref:type III-A CRISPR-associated protein Cas10/Csm1 n=1 Tax=Tenuifilum sp. TaxID=2760880 RepID=UPI002C87E63F|nr:type III-A CRISPR-associated protein Cas10/Csm1 [Bacteroidales bacterium]HPP89769.1 type III-A CRISPR-associated protein Cas10/Csm1 [Tenuifilum sp.]